MNFLNAKTIMALFALLLITTLGAARPATPVEIAADELIGKNRRIVAFSSRINPLSDCQKLEKEKFFRALAENIIYNPTFSYKPISPELRSFAATKFSTPDNGFYARLLQNSLTALKTKAAMILTKNPLIFTQLSCLLYPAPSPALVLEAQKIIRAVKVREDEKTLTAHDLKEILEQALQKYKLTNWKVVISENMSARASVSPGARKVKINGMARFSHRDARRLELHEIGVHAMRAHNGKKWPLKIFTTGLPGYLTTEEGLAVYNEFSNGIEDGLPLFALRVLGVHWALKHSFYETFKLLTNVGASPEVAWRVTLRCKRGLYDTSAPGAYTKDASYLRGFITIKKAMHQNPEIFAELLKAGKAGLEHLELLRQADF